MPAKATYLFIAAMDVDADKEALFNEVYDTEHIPALLEVRGVTSAKRAVRVPLRVSIGGETRTMVAEGEPRYSAMFEIEDRAVLTSDAWARAVEHGQRAAWARPMLARAPRGE